MKYLKQIFLNVIAIIILIIFLFPIYWMIITSLKSTKEIFSMAPTFFPKKIDWSGYLSQFIVKGSGSILHNIGNSIIIASITTIFSIIMASLSAYGLARFNFKINKIILFTILITQMFPTVLFLSPLFIMFRKIGVFNTLIAPVIYVSIHSIPFVIITLRPYFLAIPKSLEDAGIIDGCNRFTVFTRIIIPIAYPGLIVSMLFTFLWGWGDLMGALTFIKNEYLYPLTVNMYRAIGHYGIQWNSLMAFAVILTIPVIVMFVFAQKYLVSGITSGAIKG